MTAIWKERRRRGEEKKINRPSRTKSSENSQGWSSKRSCQRDGTSATLPDGKERERGRDGSGGRGVGGGRSCSPADQGGKVHRDHVAAVALHDYKLIIHDKPQSSTAPLKLCLFLNTSLLLWFKSEPVSKPGDTNYIRTTTNAVFYLLVATRRAEVPLNRAERKKKIRYKKHFFIFYFLKEGDRLHL